MQVITLDPADQLLTRLRAVNGSNHIVTQFYPRITKDAGSKIVPKGVVIMLQLALADYADGMPAFMLNALVPFMPKWIEAVIGEGKPEFLAEALGFWKEVSA